MTDENMNLPAGEAVEEGVGEQNGDKPTSGGVTEGDPSKVGGGPGGEKELGGADALGGSDADIGRGGD